MKTLCTKNFLAFTFATALFLGLTNTILAANDTTSHDVLVSIPEIAMLRLTNSSQVTLGVSAPTNAGDAPVESASDSSKWLQYTSLVASGTSRAITVESDVAIPSGLVLNVTSAAPSGGFGTTGSAVQGGVTLSTTPQNLVTGIGSAWTGVGGSNGANLTYTLSIDTDNVASLEVTDTTLSITFTLTDAN